MATNLTVKFLLNWNGEPGLSAGYEEQFVLEMPADAIPSKVIAFAAADANYEVLRRTWDLTEAQTSDGYTDVVIRADETQVIFTRRREAAERAQLSRRRSNEA